MFIRYFLIMVLTYASLIWGFEFIDQWQRSDADFEGISWSAIVFGMLPAVIIVVLFWLLNIFVPTLTILGIVLLKEPEFNSGATFGIAALFFVPFIYALISPEAFGFILDFSEMENDGDYVVHYMILLVVAIGLTVVVSKSRESETTATHVLSDDDDTGNKTAAMIGLFLPIFTFNLGSAIFDQPDTVVEALMWPLMRALGAYNFTFS